MTKPVAGDAVLYTPGTNESIARADGQKLAAIIACACSDDTVNLCVFDRDGVTANRTGVLMAQGDTARPEEGHYCEWPNEVVAPAVQEAPLVADAPATDEPAAAPAADATTDAPATDAATAPAVDAAATTAAK